MSKHLRLPLLKEMSADDILLGLGSNGVHSNGFSLVRRIIGREGIAYTDAAPWDNSTTVGLSLLTPTKIYVRSLQPVIKKGVVKGLAHITGGGLIENIPRMLPKHLAAEVDVASWELPPVFRWLKKAGNVEPLEMGRTFNTGIGMVAVVGKDHVQQVIAELESAGEKVYKIGRLVTRTTDACTLKNLRSWD
jgi:phosphoribosylamine--glycine ligase/phosphoribosylformylglycinamidine cyclo-ligase